MPSLTLLPDIESRRKAISASLQAEQKSRLGQYFTPWRIAEFIARQTPLPTSDTITVLDAGAGIGHLSIAFLRRIIGSHIKQVHLICYELDPGLSLHLERHLLECKNQLENLGIALHLQIKNKDFIQDAAILYKMGTAPHIDVALLNPPYHKLSSRSQHRKLLRMVGIETVNLYTAFVALALQWLSPRGILVAITPRSFCNGLYYKPFRRLLLEQNSLQYIHLFTARDKAFSDDKVLQENVIFKIKKAVSQQKNICISESTDGTFSDVLQRLLPSQSIIRPHGQDRFIFIPTRQQESTEQYYRHIKTQLSDIAAEVSTGPVVDFRVKEHLAKMPNPATIPLYYPAHLNHKGLSHPLPEFKKYNAIANTPDLHKWFFPEGYFTVVKRFTSKEEPRRIVARVATPEDASHGFIAFENHLNVFHHKKNGLSELLAYGLAVYLNSGLLDNYFRLFSGHTQVNATDLRMLPYPTEDQLLELGKWGQTAPEFDPSAIDTLIKKICRLPK